MSQLQYISAFCSAAINAEEIVGCKEFDFFKYYY